MMENSTVYSYAHVIPDNDGFHHVELAECDCNPQLTCVGVDIVYIHTNMKPIWKKDVE